MNNRTNYNDLLNLLIAAENPFNDMTSKEIRVMLTKNKKTKPTFSDANKFSDANLVYKA